MSNDSNITTGADGHASATRAPEPTVRPAFDLPLTRRMARWAQAAYEGCIILPGGECQVVAGPMDTRALVWISPYEIIISVRGTVDLRNWLLNLNVEKKDFLSGKVHAGFLKAAEALRDSIIKLLLPTGEPKCTLPQIRLTGHSLGGAVASLLAMRLRWLGCNVASVHTFASPRVGNAAWRKAYNDALLDRTWRMVAASDLVPLLPGLLDGYRHVGQEVYLDGRICLSPSRWLEITADSWRAARAMERLDFDFILQFHSMERDYLKLLGEARPATV